MPVCGPTRCCRNRRRCSSRHLHLLLEVEETITSLLFPFQLQGVYVTLLPSKLLDFLHSPVPFLAGVLPSWQKNRSTLRTKTARTDFLDNRSLDLKSVFVANPPNLNDLDAAHYSYSSFPNQLRSAPTARLGPVRKADAPWDQRTKSTRGRHFNSQTFTALQQLLTMQHTAHINQANSWDNLEQRRGAGERDAHLPDRAAAPQPGELQVDDDAAGGVPRLPVPSDTLKFSGATTADEDDACAFFDSTRVSLPTEDALRVTRHPLQGHAERPKAHGQGNERSQRRRVRAAVCDPNG